VDKIHGFAGRNTPDFHMRRNKGIIMISVLTVPDQILTEYDFFLITGPELAVFHMCFFEIFVFGTGGGSRKILRRFR
jgi:hypothetical protein